MLPTNLDPVQVTAWATVSLAAVGILGFIASAILAFFTWRLARHTKRAAEAAVDAVHLQERELTAVTRQLDLAERDQNLRTEELAAADRRREADLDRAASAEIVLSDLGGEHTSGGLDAPPTNLKISMVVTNKGPGYAKGVAFGVRLGTYGFTMRDDIGAMSPGEVMHGSVQIDDAATAGLRGDPIKAFTRWLRFEDVLGRRWILNQAPGDKVATKERTDRDDSISGQ